MAFDNAGNLWIANSSGGVSEFSSAGSPVSASPYIGAGISGPRALAVDGLSQIWIANAGSHSVTKLDTTGALVGTYASGQAGNGAIAIDQSGNAWAAANASGSLLRITPTGTVSIFTGGGLTTTTSIAIDPQGQIWATGSANSLSAFTQNGTPLSPATFTGGGLNNPQSVAILH